MIQAEKNAPMGRFSLNKYVSPVLMVLLGLSWLMPLHFLPWLSWHSEVLSFSTVVFFVSYCLLSTEKKELSGAIYFPITVLPFIGLGLIAGIQGATGQITFWGDVFILWFYMALCISCAVLGFAVCRQGKYSVANACHISNLNSALTFLAISLILIAFASAVVAFAQVFQLWENSPLINQMSPRRPGGNVGQANHLATLLLMGIISLLFLYESRKLAMLVVGLVFLILCAALVMTESRTGVLSFLLLTGWWLIKNKRVKFRLPLLVILIANMGFLGFFWIWPSLFDFILQNTGPSAEVNIEAGSRLVVWPQLMEALALRPWWGWGLGEIAEAQNAVAHNYSVSEPFSYSHNILLDLALGIGMPLTILFVLIMATWLWRRMRRANKLPLWYCLALALPLSVHSMLEFPFAYAYFLVPVMFVLGVLESMLGSKPVFQVRANVVIALFLGVSIAMAWSVREYFVIEEDFRVARFEALSVGKTPLNYERPKVFLLTQLGALLGGARIVPKPNMGIEELALAKKTAMRYPWTATQNRYALSLALNGNTEEAIRQLRVMRALHGEKTYKSIRENWSALAQDKYPQLREVKIP